LGEAAAAVSDSRASPANYVQACRQIYGSDKPAAPDLPPLDTLTNAELTRLVDTRACLKSYSQDFPGGEDAFIKADSAAVKADLGTVRNLFDQAQLGPTGLVRRDFATIEALTLGKPIYKFPINNVDPQRHRKSHINDGWNREQVLLWGNYFLTIILYKEGRYEEVVKEASSIRSEFGLNVVPITHWDGAEDATYYSPATLRNLIAISDYAAKAKLLGRNKQKSGRKSADMLTEDFLKNRDALAPLFQLGIDPTDDMLATYCQARLKATKR
jgi:hypothetical protein